MAGAPRAANCENAGMRLRSAAALLALSLRAAAQTSCPFPAAPPPARPAAKTAAAPAPPAPSDPFAGVRSTLTELKLLWSARRVPGRAMEDEAVRVLSRNPVGRRVLAGLRRSPGVPSFPHFTVQRLPGALAQYQPVLDNVAVAEDQVTGRGWSVDRFLAEPALQRRLVREMRTTVVHELTHGLQGRVSMFDRSLWTFDVMEAEYEAFLVEHEFVHEELKADPRADLLPEDLRAYADILDDAGGWLARMDSNGAYAKNRRRDTPRWEKFCAGVAPGWPAHRVEGYLNLARRAPDASKERAAWLAKARAAAASAGLPAPAQP